MFVVHTPRGPPTRPLGLPINKLWRSGQIGVRIGSDGPCGRILTRGEPGGDRARGRPIEGELVIDKPGKGSFYATDLDLLLRTQGVTHLIFTGITTDVCVHTTMRDANDRGYECLLLTDCTGTTDPGNYRGRPQDDHHAGGCSVPPCPPPALLSSLSAGVGAA